MKNTAILHYIDQLGKNMNGDIWVEETFGKKLHGINEDTVFNRPQPNVHSVGEVISHLLEWRISILNLLRGGLRTLTDAGLKNWRTNEELSQIGWQSLLASFNKSQEEIIETLHGKHDSFLQQKANGEKHELQYYLDGLLQHDMYHLGQIGLILKLQKTI